MNEMIKRIIELRESDITSAVQKTSLLGLITADSAHIAVMERKRIRNLATSNNDFKVIPDITLWMPS